MRGDKRKRKFTPAYKRRRQQIHAASVTHRLLQAEGLAGIDGGTRGHVRECKGTCGSACRSGGAA